MREVRGATASDSHFPDELFAAIASDSEGVEPGRVSAHARVVDDLCVVVDLTVSQQKDTFLPDTRV